MFIVGEQGWRIAKALSAYLVEELSDGYAFEAFLAIDMGSAVFFVALEQFEAIEVRIAALATFSTGTMQHFLNLEVVERAVDFVYRIAHQFE